MLRKSSTPQANKEQRSVFSDIFLELGLWVLKAKLILKHNVPLLKNGLSVENQNTFSLLKKKTCCLSERKRKLCQKENVYTNLTKRISEYHVQIITWKKNYREISSKSELGQLLWQIQNGVYDLLYKR
jgi:hypothetical protein